MESSEEEREIVAWFLSQHWTAFAEATEDYLSQTARHRLAEKPGLEDAEK